MVKSRDASGTSQFQNPVFKLSQAGAATFEDSSNSTTAFQIQNANDYNVLGADTTDGWATLGTSNQVNGALTVFNSTNTNSVELLSGATSTSYTITLPTTGSSGAQCLQGTSGSTTTVTVLTFASCGSGGSGIANQTTAQSANMYVQAATSGSVAGVFRANASGTGDILDLRNGGGTAVATFGSAGATLFQNSTNSNTAFQIQNSAGNNIFTVGTTNSDLVTNAGFDVSAANWTAFSGGTLSQDTSAGNAYSGIGALKSAATAASQGMETASFTSSLATGTQYQLTFYAKCSGSITSFTYGRDDVSGTNINATTTGTCNTNWQQYTWHFTTGGTLTSPFIYMQSGSGGSNGFNLWIDAVSLIQTTTSAATNYQPGSVYLSGVVASPMVFENSANSTLAFQIQNSSGTNEIDIDTTDNQVIIGTGTAAVASPTLVVLASGNSTDPSGVAGAMYYNSSLNTFRCYQDGLWQDCVGLGTDSTRSTEFQDDDFFGNSTTAGTGPWTCAAISAGTFPAATVTVKHPGIDVATSSTTASSGYECGTSASLFTISGGETFETEFDPLTFTNTTVRLGFLGTFTAALPSNGVFVTLSSSGVATGQTDKAGTLSSTGTTYTLSTATWYRLKITLNPAGTTATYAIYNMSGASLWTDTISTNIPTVSVGTGFTATNSGTTATALDDIDYMAEWYTGVYAR